MTVPAAYELKSLHHVRRASFDELCDMTRGDVVKDYEVAA